MEPFRASTPFVSSFSLPEHGEHIAGGCAVVVAPADQELSGPPLWGPDESDDFGWGDAQTTAFLAGEPLTLGWASPCPVAAGSSSAYVCCWVTIESD
jgi:hypothetical protein